MCTLDEQIFKQFETSSKKNSKLYGRQGGQLWNRELDKKEITCCSVFIKLCLLLVSMKVLFKLWWADHKGTCTQTAITCMMFQEMDLLLSLGDGNPYTARFYHFVWKTDGWNQTRTVLNTSSSLKIFLKDRLCYLRRGWKTSDNELTTELHLFTS
jgi:hypothetical protein